MERVIFDTNAYRYLVKGLNFKELDSFLEDIREKEKRNGLEASISPVVMQELLAHVANRNTASHQKCLNALKAMHLHCFEDGQYRMLARPEMLVAQYIFDVYSPRKIQTSNAFIEIAAGLSKSPTDDMFAQFQGNLNKIREFIQNAERLYAEEFLKVLKRYDPDMDGWRVFPNNPEKRKKLLKVVRSHEFSIEIIKDYIQEVYNYYSKDNPNLILPDEDQWRVHYERFIANFPEYITLYKSVYEHIINSIDSDFNMFEKDRSNFWWDTQLMLNVGDHKILGDKLYFVTSDKAMLKAARENNGKLSVLTFAEYIEYLG